MDIRKLQRAIVDGLEDVKAHDIRIYNTEQLTSEFERVIVASGTSNRQTKALAVSVRDAVKSRGMPVLSVEGEVNGEWIIVDCGAAVAHIMQPAIRQYYNLEELWGGKAVNVKLGGGLPTGASAAAKRAEPEAKVTAAKKTPAKKTAAKKVTAKKTVVKKAAGRNPVVKTPAAKKTASRTASGRKSPPPRRKA